MNKLLLSSAIAAILMLSGCGQKTPAVEAETEPTAKAIEIEPVHSESSADKPVEIEESKAATVNLDSDKPNKSQLEDALDIVHFSFDKYNLSEENAMLVEYNSNKMNSDTYSSYTFLIEGHCDEFGSDEYNFALGLKRANSVKSYLVANGVAEEKVQLISKGKLEPLCMDKTASCYQQNRRATVRLK